MNTYLIIGYANQAVMEKRGPWSSSICRISTLLQGAFCKPVKYVRVRSILTLIYGGACMNTVRVPYLSTRLLSWGVEYLKLEPVEEPSPAVAKR